MGSEVIWVEVLARRRENVTRQRVEGDVITVGRAYDNDVVVDDPHVAPHHLRLLRSSDGSWSAEDLGTLNGTFVTGVRHDHAQLDGETLLQVGQTGIRLRSSASAVPPELPLLRIKSRWPLAILCLAAVLGLALLELWLEETGEPKLISYLMLPLSTAAVVMVWAALWSVLSRIFTGHAQYGRHLFIACAGLLVYTAYGWLARVGAFALSLPPLTAYDFVATWPILAIVCFAHLRAIGPSRLALKAVCMLLLAGLGIGVQSLSVIDTRTRSNQPTTALLTVLEPPALRLVPPQTQDAFFSAAASLKTPLDEARAKDSPSSDEDGEDGD